MANILVVDDVPEINLLYSKVLAKKGHTVTVAASVMQAMVSVNNEEFDYIFLDMKMPDFDGLDFLRQAKLWVRRPQTKVIALSNSESEVLMKKAKALGVSEYLIKIDYSPYGVAELLDRGRL